jgi:glycosyltransferase involved in cell wall biosynthesis
MLMLSVIIITKDAGDHIRQCLESVKWADEIIVLDSGSNDNTLEICTEYTSQVFSTDWPGFGMQKNRALAKAQGQWVLSIDADEVLSAPLIDEIKRVISDSRVREEAYAIKRVSFFYRKKIKYGDWGHDYVVRLFRNQAMIQFSPVLIHETLIGYRRLGHLKAFIFHQAIKNIDHLLNKLASYSTIGAQLAYQRHKKTSLFKAISHGLWCFIRGYFIRLGFLDGRAGLILAFSNAAGVFYRYTKLIYLYQLE